jgi:flagellar basal body-associated protein FliL
MIVVAVIAVGFAFIFATRIHSPKDVYDITKSADASASEPSYDDENNPADGSDSNTEKDEKSEETKSKIKDKEKKKDKIDNNDESEKSNSVLGKILVPMQSIVVNLGKADSKRYLRVIISLEVKNSEIEETVKANKVIFRDKLVSYLSSKKVSEVSTQEGYNGLRTEIKNILNSELLESDDAISQVYFSDFIVQ